MLGAKKGTKMKHVINVSANPDLIVSTEVATMQVSMESNT